MKILLLIFLSTFSLMLKVVRKAFLVVAFWGIINLFFSSLEWFIIIEGYKNLFWILVIVVSFTLRVILNKIIYKIDFLVPQSSNRSSKKRSKTILTHIKMLFLRLIYISIILLFSIGSILFIIGIINLARYFILNDIPSYFIILNYNPVILIIFGNILIAIAKILNQKVIQKKSFFSTLATVFSGNSSFEDNELLQREQLRFMDEQNRFMNEQNRFMDEHQRMHDNFANNHNHHNF